jgi:O-antigen/teichoic acid export membrane protein
MKNFLKASMITGSAFFINILFNAIRAKIVAVFLGPGGVAVLAQLGGFTTIIITLSSFGLGAAIVRFIAEYNAEERHQDLKQLIATATLYVTVVSISVTALMLLFIPEASRLIFGKEAFLLLIGLSLLNVPVAVVTNLAVSLLQGFKEIKTDAIFSVFSTVVVFIVLIALLIPFGLTGAVVGLLIANYLTSAIFFVFVLRVIGKHTDSRLSFWGLRGIRRHIKTPMLYPLIGIAVASLFGGGIANFADVLIRSSLISHFGLLVAGSIQPALTFSSQYTGLLSGSLSTYAIPRLSELARQPELFQKEYNDFVRLLLLFITPFAIGVSIFAKYLVPLFYTNQFDNSIPLVSIQAVSDILEFAFIAMAGAFLPMGRAKILLALGTIVPVAYFIAYLLLLPLISLKAVPVASGISWLAAAAISYVILRRVLDIRIRRRNFWLIGNSVAAAVIVGLLVTQLSNLVGITLSLVIMALWGVINVSVAEVRAFIQLLMGRMQKGQA